MQVANRFMLWVGVGRNLDDRALLLVTDLTFDGAVVLVTAAVPAFGCWVY